MTDFKIQKSITGASGIRKYQELILGTRSILYLLKYELIILVSSWVPGLLGLALRSKLYPLLLGRVGSSVVFGRGVVLRHPKKISIGDNVVIDDGCVLDAKGSDNKGIDISSGVYIGRNTIIYCKNGDITLGEKVNIGHNCMVFSSNAVCIGDGALIAGYTYIMSGGSYDYRSEERFINQSGYSKGRTTIGADSWLGAKVVVADGVDIGERSIIGAGAVVLDNVPGNSIAAGVPAKVIKNVR